MEKYIYSLVILIIVIINIIYIHSNYNDKVQKIINIYKPKLNKFINNLDKSGNKLFLIPLFELGDNIVINGAVRYYCTKYSQVILVCKNIYYNQISCMYQDLNNIIIYKIPSVYSNQYIDYYIPYNNNDINNLIKIHNIQVYKIKDYFVNANKLINYHYTLRTYKSLNLDLDIGYKYFKINRDYEKEKLLYNKLVSIIGYKYIVIIDDEKRNFLINNNYLKHTLPTFKLGNNSKNENSELDLIKDPFIFNYITILENAEKIISIDSSIPWLCDFLNINCKLYIYNTRQGSIQYRNKNIKLIDVDINDTINSYYNTNNYIYKYPYEYLTSYLE
jgi:hypothetical protein